MKKLYLIIILIAGISSEGYSQWNMDYMSSARAQLQSAVMGDFIYFIAGNDNLPTTTVDIYNTTNSTWMPGTNISSPRVFTASVAGDSALYVAGGLAVFANLLVGTNVVDIYKNGTWSTHTLPEYIWAAQAVHVGTKILIAGSIISFNVNTGVPVVSDLVHKYDELTDTWSTDTLFEPRGYPAVATDGVIAIFAGGLVMQNQPSDVVDIYNSVTDTWTATALSEPRAQIGGVYAGGKFYFAGGGKAGVNNSSDVVDIYDGINWTVDHLSSARGGITPCTAGDKIFFPGGGNLNLVNLNYTSSESLVDVYDITQGSWSTSNMNFDKINQTAVGVGSKVYVAGGVQIFNGNLLDAVEVWDVSTGVHSVESFGQFKTYPIPVSDVLSIAGITDFSQVTEARITNVAGVNKLTITNLSSIIDVSNLETGFYFLRITNKHETKTVKFIKD